MDAIKNILIINKNELKSKKLNSETKDQIKIKELILELNTLKNQDNILNTKTSNTTNNNTNQIKTNKHCDICNKDGHNAEKCFRTNKCSICGALPGHSSQHCPNSKNTETILSTFSLTFPTENQNGHLQYLKDHPTESPFKYNGSYNDFPF